MSEKKAKLTIILKADESVVAEVENPKLWQEVLAAIHQDSQDGLPKNGQEKILDDHHQDLGATKDYVSTFAKELGVDKDAILGALDPKTEAPYITVDSHYWEAFKKQMPVRGRGAISPTGLIGTLLALWFKHTGLGQPTQVQALEILDEMGVTDKNSSRGVKSTKWLQPRRGGVIQINPAQVSAAISVAKNFCTKNWKENGNKE